MDKREGRLRVAVIGGVAGGMSAAARLRRLKEDCDITVYERGEFVSFANCGLPYYLGREIVERGDLILQTPGSLKERFNIDVRTRHEVVEVNVAEKTLKVRNLANDEQFVDSFDELIVSSGASPIIPRIPGADLPGVYVLRSLADADQVDAWIHEKSPKNVVVVGGGFIGLEVAEQLSNRGLDVTIVDAQNQVLPPVDPEFAELVHQELARRGVKLVLGCAVTEFEGPSAHPASPKCCWVHAGDAEPIAADMVILGIGVRPEISMARAAGLSIGARGGLVVSPQLETNIDHVWGIGDAIEVRQPLSNQSTLLSLGGPANRQGRLVAENITGSKGSYKGTIGTSIVRVFDLVIASVGLSEKQLRDSGSRFEAVHLHPLSHAGYFPGAKRLELKLLFEPNSGAILGAQIAGSEGVDKRIDVLATAVKGKMSVRDLADLELAYSPPFGSAKDPINMAGMVASNVLDGLVEQVDPAELFNDDSDLLVLDVRTPAERSRGFIPDSLSIPLRELRARFVELPKEKTIAVSCQSGQRSYFACRFLKQMGFNVKNVSGGYLTWSAMEAFRRRLGAKGAGAQRAIKVP